MRREAILAIDMLRGFLEEGFPLYCGEKARAIIPNVVDLLRSKVAQGSKIIFICDNHLPDDIEFKVFPPHCISGTEEAEIIPELSSFRAELVCKQRYSGFYNTKLDMMLREMNPDKLIACGVCTDICVMHTVADARNRDYEVEIPQNCVASFNEDNHRFALQHMEKVLGVRII